MKKSRKIFFEKIEDGRKISLERKRKRFEILRKCIKFFLKKRELKLFDNNNFIEEDFQSSRIRFIYIPDSGIILNSKNENFYKKL